MQDVGHVSPSFGEPCILGPVRLTYLIDKSVVLIGTQKAFTSTSRSKHQSRILAWGKGLGDHRSRRRLEPGSSTRPSKLRAAKNGVAFIGCAPGQWLAVAGGSHAAGFVANLTQALGRVASVTDHTSAKTVVRISGARAREVLAKGRPIDLHPRVFKPGDAATTRIVLIGCTLWQVDAAPTYDLAVNSSIVRSFWSWLTASAAECGYEVVRTAPQE